MSTCHFLSSIYISYVCLWYQFDVWVSNVSNRWWIRSLWSAAPLINIPVCSVKGAPSVLAVTTRRPNVVIHASPASILSRQPLLITIIHFLLLLLPTHAFSLPELHLNIFTVLFLRGCCPRALCQTDVLGPVFTSPFPVLYALQYFF